MKVTLESTQQIVDIEPRPEGGPKLAQVRVWVGTTESGIPIQALILRVAVQNQHSQAEFERELQEQPAPAPAVQAFPLRMIL